MPTATYEDFKLRNPGSTAPRDTVDALLGDVAAEIAARCLDRGTTYEALVDSREDVVVKVECAVVGRICGRPPVDGIEQTGLKSFSQTVGDHRWEREYPSVNANTTPLRDEWKSLGLYGQQIGYVKRPCLEDGDD